MKFCFIAESKLSTEDQTEEGDEESSEDSHMSECLEKHVHEFLFSSSEATNIHNMGHRCRVQAYLKPRRNFSIKEILTSSTLH